MNHSFWLINSCLFVLVACASFFVYFSPISLPEREDIEPLLYSKPRKEQFIAINIKYIYENDLFGTYQKELPRIERPEITVPFPQPPRPQPTILPEPPKPKFLDPLNITLKGIIVLSFEDIKNRAIIMMNKTSEEVTYKIGDIIEDAQLIRIFNNKVIFLRANGQQEVLYLREQDARFDPAYAIIDGWDNVVQKQDAFHYIVNLQAFIKRVTNISQCIDFLGLTTAYKQGVSVGTRIGNIDSNGLGIHLGLQQGDIILSINGIAATTSDNRLKIYNMITEVHHEETIVVELMRNKKHRTHMYIVHDFGPEEEQLQSSTPKEPEPKSESKNVVDNKITPEPEPNEQQYEEYEQYGKATFAPLLKEINSLERQNMLAHGRIA